jgi:O-antigen/teichoic acid export membrane protein
VQVGLYGVPSKIYDSLIGIALLFVGLFAPLLANTARRDLPAFQQHLNSALITLSIGVVSMAVALVVFAPELVRFLGGSDFIAGVPVLRLLAALLVIRSATLLLRETVIALHQQQQLLVVYAVTFVVAFAGFFLLIPWLGGIGAALAFLAAEVILLLCLSRIVIRAAARLSVFRKPFAILICGIATGASAVWLESAGYNVFARATFAGLIYVMSLFASRAVTVDMLVTLRQDIAARKS